MWAPALSAVLSVFVDSRALCRGAGDEESEQDGNDLLGADVTILVTIERGSDSEGEERRGSLMGDVEAHWIGRMMSAERRLREGVDFIARRMFRRRRDVGKGTPMLGLRDEPNARDWRRSLCYLSWLETVAVCSFSLSSLNVGVLDAQQRVMTKPTMPTRRVVQK